jgi:hypothetical protein
VFWAQKTGIRLWGSGGGWSVEAEAAFGIITGPVTFETQMRRLFLDAYWAGHRRNLGSPSCMILVVRLRVEAVRHVFLWLIVIDRRHQVMFAKTYTFCWTDCAVDHIYLCPSNCNTIKKNSHSLTSSNTGSGVTTDAHSAAILESFFPLSPCYHLCPQTSRSLHS